MNDFTPVYIRIAAELRQKIYDGEIRMGEPIPSEHALMAAYGTTRGTARSAVQVLASEGLVRQVRGRGTFVQMRPAEYSVKNFGGFTDSLSPSQTAVSRIVKKALIDLDGDSYLQLIRARGISNGLETEYLSIDESIIPTEIFPGIEKYDLKNESLYATFRREYRINPYRTQIILRSERQDQGFVELLGHGLGDKLLVAEGVAYDQTGREIEKIKVIYSDSVKFELNTLISEVPRSRD